MASKNRTVERRFHTGQIEQRTHGSELVIEGYAAVFGKRSHNLGGFVEQIDSRAMNKTVREADVRGLWNHDSNFVLGRNKAGTLDLAPDSQGLHFRARPGDTSYARDLAILLDRGDVDQASFAFRTISDDWNETEEGTPLRTLQEVALVDISVVTYPAYPDASSGLARSAALTGLAKRSGLAVDDLTDEDAILRAIRGDERSEETTEDDEPGDPTRTALWERRARFAADLERALRQETY